MKFTTTALALTSLYSADAFMVQAPTDVMQPLHMDRSGYGNSQSQFAPSPRTRAPVRGEPNRGQQVRQAPPAPFAPSNSGYDSVRTTREVFETITPVKVQGGSLRTCSFGEDVNRVSVLLKTTGRPLNANIELWQGPDNAPQKMSVYLEDGEKRPFRAIVESPGGSNAIAIRNTGQMELPLTAGLECDRSYTAPAEILSSNSDSRIVQGGAVFTTPFPPAVQSVQVGLRTDGRPLNARIELLQGPNNNKQVMDIYTEDGGSRPFYAIIDTPGSGNVVRIVNTATVEFPLTASLDSYIIDGSIEEESSVNGGMQWS